jgi:hypothetical protein
MDLSLEKLINYIYTQAMADGLARTCLTTKTNLKNALTVNNAVENNGIFG